MISRYKIPYYYDKFKATIVLELYFQFDIVTTQIRYRVNGVLIYSSSISIACY